MYKEIYIYRHRSHRSVVTIVNPVPNPPGPDPIT